MSERWKPGNGEHYYYFYYDGDVDSDVWRNDSTDRQLFERGNCFRTEAEAEAAAEKVKELLLSLHEPATECSQLPKLTAEVFDRPAKLPDWCKVGEWVYHDSDGYYYKIKSIDQTADNIQITDDESEYTYTANEIKTFFSEARLRPYNAEEMKSLVGRTVDCDYGAVCLVTKFCPTSEGGEVLVDGVYYNANTLLGEFTINNNPCGVLEHLENGEWV